MIDQNAREAEVEIDRAFLQHPLLRFRYDPAVFTTLVAAEELLDTFRGAYRQTRALAIDTIINGLKYAIDWLWNRRNDMRTNEKASLGAVETAKSFLLLAIEYVGMVAAYTYGSRGFINVTLDERTLRVSGELLKDTRYEAYNFLLKPSIGLSIDRQQADDAEFLEEVKRAWGRGVKFTDLPIDSSVLSAAYKIVAQHSESFYTLPRRWTFDTFSLRAFRSTHDVLGAIVYAWKRIAAVLDVASDQLPYGPSLPFAVSKHVLLSAISDVSGMAKSEVRAVVAILEYGSGGITDPDPALQPLVPLTNGHYLLSAPLVLGSAAERNLTVLVNRLPKEKRAYARLTNEKELAMRNRMKGRLPAGFETWSGRLSKRENLGGVDLALVDRRDSVLLLLELKWFVDPAEVRELIDRSKELARGVAQCKRLAAAVRDSPRLLETIPGGPFDDFMTAVVSANWIGFADVQDSEVPIINEEHLMRKIGVASRLSDVLCWLRLRQYLPTEGGDYEVRSRLTQVDTWQLDWYRIKALTEDFMPT